MAEQQPTKYPRKNSYSDAKRLQQQLLEKEGRIAPRDLEVEEAVLGALMLEKDAYTTVCDLLKPECFYDPGHQKIYEAIQQLGASQQSIDMLTVTQRLRANGELKNVGGPAAISELTARVASGAHVEFHARIVAQKYLARELINFSAQIEEKAFDESNDVDDLLQEAEGRLFEISQRNVKKDVTQIDPVIKQALEQIEAAANRESGLSGLETGFRELDKLTSGWQNSDLIIIAARPAMGKTAFVLNIAQYVAFKKNKGVAIFSLEMSKEQLVNRMFSLESQVDAQALRTGNLKDSEWEKLIEGAGIIGKSHLVIDDTPGISVSELRSKCRKYKLEQDLQLVIIDYLQLMSGSVGGKSESRQQEISEISRSLKALARELNVPVIALSQLSRAVESRPDKRPMLSDLRESGAIEQDADVVMFIYRDEYYNKDSEFKKQAEIIIAKQRNGPVGTVNLAWLGEYTKFANLSRQE